MMTEYVVAGGIVAIVLIAWSVSRGIHREDEARARKINEVFSGRESLTSDMFYDRYFRSKGIKPEIVDDIRRILQKQLNADMSRLSDEDDFSKNLSFFWDFDSMADVELIIAIEEHFKIKITDKEAEQTHTISDLVQLVSNKCALTTHKS